LDLLYVLKLAWIFGLLKIFLSR